MLVKSSDTYRLKTCQRHRSLARDWAPEPFLLYLHIFVTITDSGVLLEPPPLAVIAVVFVHTDLVLLSPAAFIIMTPCVAGRAGAAQSTGVPSVIMLQRSAERLHLHDVRLLSYAALALRVMGKLEASKMQYRQINGTSSSPGKSERKMCTHSSSGQLFTGLTPSHG